MPYQLILFVGDSMPVYANWRLKVMDHNRPEPLPFPPNGGCWSPLVDYLPEKNSPAVPLHRFVAAHNPPSHFGIQLFDAHVNFFPPLRCNIAVILLTDLIVDHGVKVEWSAYIHLLLHAIFIGNFLLTLYASHTTDTMPLFSSVSLFWILLMVTEIYRIVFIMWLNFPLVVRPWI